MIITREGEMPFPWYFHARQSMKRCTRRKFFSRPRLVPPFQLYILREKVEGHFSRFLSWIWFRYWHMMLLNTCKSLLDGTVKKRWSIEDGWAIRKSRPSELCRRNLIMNTYWNDLNHKPSGVWRRNRSNNNYIIFQVTHSPLQLPLERVICESPKVWEEEGSISPSWTIRYKNFVRLPFS